MNTISYNFGIAALSRLLLGGISLVIVGFLTRYLGPSGYGNYNLILAYLYIFVALADLGLNTILVRDISRSGADEEKITNNIFTLRLILVLGFVLAGIIISFFLSYSPEVKIGIAIASLFAIFSSISQVLVGLFQKHLRLYFVSFADVVARGLQLLIIILLIKNNPTFLAFVWAIVISEVVHFLIIFLFSKKIVNVKFSFDVKYWIATIKNAIPVALSLVFVLLYFKMDTILLSLMKPAFDVGIYSVAYKILETIIFLPALYIGLVMPILSRYAHGDKEKFVKSYRKSFNILVMFALPIIAFIYLRAGDIINIIGGQGYDPSIGVLKILSVAIMLIFFGNLAGNALIALNLQKKGVWIYLTGAVFNIGANIVFIPKYSYIATAWTTVVTELLITVFLFLLIKKQTSAFVEFGVALRALLATGIIAISLSLMDLGLISFCALSLFYFPVLYLLGGFSVDDLREIIKIKPNGGTIG